MKRTTLTFSIVVFILFGMLLTLMSNDRANAQCPDSTYEGPYWKTVPHPFAYTSDCDVMFEYCVARDTAGKLFIFIGVM